MRKSLWHPLVHCHWRKCQRRWLSLVVVLLVLNLYVFIDVFLSILAFIVLIIQGHLFQWCFYFQNRAFLFLTDHEYFMLQEENFVLMLDLHWDIRSYNLIYQDFSVAFLHYPLLFFLPFLYYQLFNQFFSLNQCAFLEHHIF